jgi:hypothetical protein
MTISSAAFACENAVIAGGWYSDEADPFTPRSGPVRYLRHRRRKLATKVPSLVTATAATIPPSGKSPSVIFPRESAPAP